MEAMNMRVNDDGKFFGRVVAAFAGAVPVLIIGGIVWWSDGRLADSRAAEAITRIEKRIDTVEAEAREARKNAAEDRQKIAEMFAELRSTSRGVSRIESLLDRWSSAPPQTPLRP